VPENLLPKRSNRDRRAYKDRHARIIIMARRTTSLKPDCACALRRKGGTGAPLPTGSPFSAVRFEDEILQNTGTFRAFCGYGRRTLSAVQTAWRRGRDSNPRYYFDVLSFDVSVSYRLQNIAREFRAKI
jgi:hypothetical protein